MAGPGYAAVTADELLGPDDGPHTETAERFTHRAICLDCWEASPYDDDLCAGCVQRLLTPTE